MFSLWRGLNLAAQVCLLETFLRQRFVHYYLIHNVFPSQNVMNTVIGHQSPPEEAVTCHWSSLAVSGDIAADRISLNSPPHTNGVVDNKLVDCLLPGTKNSAGLCQLDI